MPKTNTKKEEIFAIVKIGGKQYKVAEGNEFLVDFINVQKISLKPYLVVDGEKTFIGKPEVKEYNCDIEVVKSRVKGEKKMIFRYKPKTGYHSKKGPRALYTLIKINNIKKSK